MLNFSIFVSKFLAMIHFVSGKEIDSSKDPIGGATEALLMMIFFNGFSRISFPKKRFWERLIVGVMAMTP